MSNHSELSTGVSADELEALADGVRVPASQARLTELLAQNAAGNLSTEGGVELDRLLNRVDQLAILKARARYTLRHSQLEAASL